MKPIPYGRQFIDDEDIESVVKVLRSSWISQGPTIRNFEQSFSRYCGVKYAVAVSSGTAGLHLACLAAGLKTGDEAITTPITFIATANAVLFTGARPVFADIDYETVNLDPEAVCSKITKRTKAVLPVHFGGLPADMAEFAKIAKSKGLWIIEDACHALGAEYGGEKVGSCRYSDMTVFSFHPVKAITTGEGGMVTTNNPKLYERLLRFRHHGLLRNESDKKRFGGWYYQVPELGFNYRITDFQAALGLSQLKKLHNFVDRRATIARQYNELLSPFSDYVKLPRLNYPDRSHAWHLYLFRIKAKQKVGLNRKNFYNELLKCEIHSQVHYIPIYHQPLYRKILKYRNVLCPNAEKYYSETLSLPIFPRLNDGDVRYVAVSIKEILKSSYSFSTKAADGIKAFAYSR